MRTTEGFIQLIRLCHLVALVHGFTAVPPGRYCGVKIRRSTWFATSDDDGPPNNIDEYEMWDPNESQANGTPRRPNKADIYSMDELETILNLHQNLSQHNAFGSGSSSSQDVDDIMPIPGLHDMVLEALQEDQEESVEEKTSEVPSPPMYQISNELKQRIPKIRAIASDVDGTLLQSNQDIHPTTRSAVEKAISAAASPVRSLQYFFPATGKTRKGALHSLGPEIGGLLSQLPGAFLQGLYCVNATGHVIYENKLDSEELVAATEDLTHKEQLTLLAHDGDTIYTTAASAKCNPHHMKALKDWGEDEPEILETCRRFENGFHKLLVMADTPEEIHVFRSKLQAVAEEFGCMTTVSVPTMVEVLPGGSGKGAGVAKLCEALGIDMQTELLAMGDGENDLEFLQKASIGVAMGNAVDILKQSDGTDFVMSETNNEGGAGIAMELFGFGKALGDQ